MTYRGFPLVWLLALASGALVVSRARADVAVMVPPRAEEAASDASEKASEELSRLLRWQGFDVISDGQAGAAAEGQQRSGAFPRNYDPLYCITPECANEYRKLFDALFAVQLSIASKVGRPSSVTVVLTENPKSSFAATAAVEGGDVRGAVRSAYEDAREKQRDGAGPWLVINGTPEGATIYIDNAEFGHVPFKKRRIEPGQHQLDARSEGHVNETRTITIPTKIDHIEQIEIGLIRLDQPEPVAATSVRRMRRSPWDWAVGGVVAAVGAAHLIAGVYQKSKSGECADRVMGTCREVYGTEAGARRDNMMVGFGAAGVVLGGLVMGLGPLGALGVGVDREHAMLQLKGQF